MPAKKTKRTPREEEIYQKRLMAMARAREALAANRAARKAEAEAESESAPAVRKTRGRKATLVAINTDQNQPGSGRRRRILAEADSVVNGGRDQQYGQPEDNFALIGRLWSDYLGVEIKAHDVAALMMLLKVARVKTAPDKEDHWVDIAGYAACGFDCVS